MKNTRNNPKKLSRKARAFLALVCFAIIIGAICGAYSKLRGFYLEQCVLKDADRQIEVVTGKMVKRGQILELFGLKSGVNLATLDFASCRARTLRALPTIRDLSIQRHLPNRLTVVVTEREPLLRLNVRGRRGMDALGRVVDSEGVVFRCFRGTETLPILRELETDATPPGGRLTGRSMAALRLLEAASEAEYQSLGFIEADAGYSDFILVTLNNYSRAKIAWEDMSDGTGGDRADMILRLSHLQQAIRTRLVSGSVIWNATQADRIFADTKESFL